MKQFAFLVTLLIAIFGIHKADFVEFSGMGLSVLDIGIAFDGEDFNGKYELVHPKHQEIEVGHIGAKSSQECMESIHLDTLYCNQFLIERNDKLISLGISEMDQAILLSQEGLRIEIDSLSLFEHHIYFESQNKVHIPGKRANGLQKANPVESSRIYGNVLVKGFFSDDYLRHKIEELIFSELIEKISEDLLDA